MSVLQPVALIRLKNVNTEGAVYWDVPVVMKAVGVDSSTMNPSPVKPRYGKPVLLRSEKLGGTQVLETPGPLLDHVE